MSNELVCINGVRGYEKDGVAYLHIEDVARGLGFEREKNGTMYVMWDRVEQYLDDLSFHRSVENEKPRDYYIPENIFYRLCMKARNEVAEAFQAKVADEIIPSIRKTGSYQTTPKTYIEALEALIDAEKEKEAARHALALAQEAVQMTAALLENEQVSHVHDNHVKDGRYGGMTKNRNHYRSKAQRLDIENTALTKENDNLKDAVGRGKNWMTISMMRREWERAFGHEPNWKMLKAFSEQVNKERHKDVEERIVGHDGTQKVIKVYRYHIDAWEAYRAHEEFLRYQRQKKLSFF